MIKDLKELQALLKLCRKQGVTEIDWADLKLKFGDMPKKGSPEASDDEVNVDELTPEQLMFFSAGGADQ
jgi:hypothetical protein